MATFTALNIEPDEHTDDEVDNTKEIQIEDALKLYQAALKFHSQGVAHYPQATEAYIKLFNSEIFRYPESQSEFDRIYENPDLEKDATFALGLELAAAGVEDAPKTLQQILYLSYKNNGQFILDYIKSSLKIKPMGKVDLDYQAKGALNDFSHALVSDESDTELWRKAARVAAMLNSRRIARYCLEAAVEGDDDPTVTEIDPYSVEEGFAGEQLLQQLQILGDDTATAHPIMAPYMKNAMRPFLAQQMDPYPFLPDPTRSLGPSPTEGNAGNKPASVHRYQIAVNNRTWADVGEMLWNHFHTPLRSISGVELLIPSNNPSPLDEMAVDVPNKEPDRVFKDISMVGTPPDIIEEAMGEPVAPGLDDSTMEITTTTTIVPVIEERENSSTALPTRKRSQSTAGIRETPEDDSGTQKRSKRIRNRDSTLEGPPDPSTQYAEQLAVFTKADDGVFSFVGGILAKLGVEDLGTLSDLKAALTEDAPRDRVDIVVNTAVRDLRDILRAWDAPKASTFVTGNAAEILGSMSGTANAGLAAFLEHSKIGPVKFSTIPILNDSSGLDAFCERINKDWMPLEDVIWEWLLVFLPTYTSHTWSLPLKTAVVRLISITHVELYKRLKFELESAHTKNEDGGSVREIAQTIFELNLDLYTQITQPNSVVEHETRDKTKYQLDRWKEFVDDAMCSSYQDLQDHLQVRYLWSSVFYATMTEDVSREHKVLCWSDLQTTLRDAGNITIELQNNIVLPHISADAAEREVSRLSTMDFFYKLFQTDTSDPIAIIETLEPVLDPESAQAPDSVDGDPGLVDNTSVVLKEMWKFLRTGSTSLRLFLWQRLREAYERISYTTKVFSCHLKCIEVIISDLRSDDFTNTAETPRQHQLLRWLKALDDLLVKALTTALNDASTCFEIIDDRHLKSTCSALAQLSRVLHSAAVYDDEIRVGMIQIPSNGAFAQSGGSFNGFFNKLKEMQVRTWALQYTMIKEAMSQNKDMFQSPDNDLADYLALVHYSLGMRKCCRVSNKIFLKMMKVEMIRLKHVDRWEDYLGQVLFDLYGIRLGVGTYLLEDHGCPTEQLDKRTVLNIAEQVITLANKMPLKDLLKHELRPTIERMQTAVGHSKPTAQMAHNLRNYTEYLKTSIRPLDLYKAWHGLVQVDALPVTSPESPLADMNWYFLLGMIALTKFRSQKRLGPGAQQDDLRVSASFFRLQLQFNAEGWETWYRMAQCFDCELEEEVMWSADKANNHRSDLVRLQRSAIHCYTMALSCAMRTADDSSATAEKLSEMYFEFGMRMYASSRDPFGMEAFWLDDFEKHMSNPAGMYKMPLHEELRRHGAWRYAAKLFRQSLADRPKYWMSHFMLGKCLWKMFCKTEDEYDLKSKARKPTAGDVLRAFVNAIKTVPKPRDSRQEPILEPHYKLVSIVHKLVVLRILEPQAGADLLQQQPYAVDKGEAVSVDDIDEWEPYILRSLRHLRSFDKQHWHHRMVSRVVSILYDEQNPDYVAATAAIQVFRESIFTKTMHIQVWKPDAERPGRHCVYMERYVRLMTNLLSRVNDKANLEALVRRVRKKTPDFYHFVNVWTDCCTTYLKVIRRNANIPASTEEVFKGEIHEEFEAISDGLAAWAANPETRHPVLDTLREAHELKKLNASAMKPTPIDDLINDAWAMLYLQIGKQLPVAQTSVLQKAQMDGDAAASMARNAGTMNLANLVMDMDGAQGPVTVTIAGTEASRSRKVGINRREILRRAEMAVNRPVEPLRNIASASSRPQPSMILGSNDRNGAKQRSFSASASNSRAGTGDRQSRNEDAGEDEGEGNNQGDGEGEGENEGENEAEEGEGEGEAEAEEEEDEDGNREEGEEQADVDMEGEAEGGVEEDSERGSVHDSADDESDLSDLPDMDDLDSETVFPGGLSSRRSETGVVSSDGESETPG